MRFATPSRLQAAIIHCRQSLKDGLQAISNGGLFMACVVDDENRLMAILTDSDVRKAVLDGADLNDTAIQWANKNPLVLTEESSIEELVLCVQQTNKREIPLVNKQGRLSDLFIFGQSDSHLFAAFEPSFPREIQPSSVFVLAGGLGSRLRPVVSDRPILQTLIQHISSFGFRKFYVSVNYMADLIEQHLQESRYEELKIQIVRESKRLGTAGSIGNIGDELNEPLLVCNADVLSKIAFDAVLKRHKSAGADITVVVRPFEVQIPYGVTEVRGDQVVSIVEKPKFQHLVNAGIYVLSPNMIKRIKPETYLDMPDFIRQQMQLGAKVSPFLAHEFWLDVGSPEDFMVARDKFSEHFDS
jgi:dTDP-glucose pyrophosphorylase